MASKPNIFPKFKKVQDTIDNSESTPTSPDEDINCLLESSDDSDTPEISDTPERPETPDTPGSIDTPDTPNSHDKPHTSVTADKPNNADKTDTTDKPDTTEKSETADKPKPADKTKTADQPEASKTRSLPDVRYKGVPGFERADMLLGELYALLNSFPVQ